MHTLLDQLRKSRETSIHTGGWRFTVRRPTDLEVLELQERGGLTLRNSLRFVVGWDLTELDLVPSGTADPVPFDSELFADWVQDRPKLWGDIMRAIRQAYKEHADQLETDAKN